MAPRTPRRPPTAPRPSPSSSRTNRDPFDDEPGPDDVSPLDLPNTTRSLQPMRDPPVLTREEARDARPPPPGYRYTPTGELVPICDTALDIAIPQNQALFCQVVEATGSLRTAMDALGIRSKTTIERAINKFPSFAEEVEAAAERHRSAIYQSAYERAVRGHLVPIIGGKDRDTVVAWERKYSDTLMGMFLKRHFPEFRETKPAPPPTDQRPVSLPDLRKMTPEQRVAYRLLISPTPPPADATAIQDAPDDDTDPSQGN